MNCIEIDSGRVAGTASADGKVHAFKGIPYASAPSGGLRWCPPHPVRAWDHLLQADRFGPAPMQPLHQRDQIFFQAAQVLGAPESSYSEDCLSLNIWTPATSPAANLPVMLWFYGGGNRTGCGSQGIFDGEKLARKGVVMVTFNYRLGSLGFLAHPQLRLESANGASGNQSLLDDIAVLQWIKRNIAAFGGNPGCVTIFGESAGAGHVNCLMASPLAKGLFHRAIAHSSARFRGLSGMQTREQAEAAGSKFAQSQQADSLAALRLRPADELVRPMGFDFIVDGHVLAEDLDAVFEQGAQHDVPLLLGSNADEGTPYAQIADAAKFSEQARARYGAMADAFLNLYPAGDDAQAHASGLASTRDARFGWQIHQWARLHARSAKSPVFRYYFERTPPFPADARFRELHPPQRYGAFHSAEVIYAFDNLRLKTDWPWQEADYRLSEAMATYWTQFAKHGNPNGAGLPNWESFDERTGQVLHLGEAIRMGEIMHRPAMDFFDECFARQA